MILALRLQLQAILDVTDPPLLSPGVWPLKSELSGEDQLSDTLPPPTGRDNCTSAKDFASFLRLTFMEEVNMDMVIGPLTAEEASTWCNCTPDELCPGPLAAIDEGDKVRTIYDGSFGGGRTSTFRIRRLNALRPLQSSTAFTGCTQHKRKQSHLQVPLALKG